MKQALIKKIEQSDHQTFTIDWTDGSTDRYKLPELQAHCPCAGCKESNVKPLIKENVQATRIQNVGKYALRVYFTSGCSNGIYSFEYLRALKKGN